MISVWKSAQPRQSWGHRSTHQSPREMKAKGRAIRLTEEKRKGWRGGWDGKLRRGVGKRLARGGKYKIHEYK